MSNATATKPMTEAQIRADERALWDARADPSPGQQQRVGGGRGSIARHFRADGVQGAEGCAMPELTDFLLARIAEDESALRLMAIGDGWYLPDRYEAECEAKRRIVERGSDPVDNSYGLALWDVLRDLAAVYADHWDYRDEWRP